MKFNYKINKANFNLLKNDNGFIHYEFLFSDVWIDDGINTINLNFDLPLLDFSNGMVLVMNDLIEAKSGKSEFEFTEGEGLLIFNKKEELLEIRLDDEIPIMIVNFSDFCSAAIELHKSVSDFIRQHIDVNNYSELMKILYK